MLANQRRLRIVGLTLMLIGLGGLVYVEGLPIKKRAQATGDEGQKVTEKKLDFMKQKDNALHLEVRAPTLPPQTLPKLADNVIQPLLSKKLPPSQPQGHIQAQDPPQGVEKMAQPVAGNQQGLEVGGVQQLGGPQNPVQLQVPEREEAAKPDNKVIENQQQLPAGGAPNGGPADELHAPPAPDAGGQPKDMQLQKPNAEDNVVGHGDNDLHPIRKAFFKDSHLPLKVCS